MKMKDRNSIYKRILDYRNRGFEVYVTQPSSDDQRKALGFQYYERRPRRVWAKTAGVNDMHSPIIHSATEKLTFTAGYYIIYDPTRLKDDYTEYEGIHCLKTWPVSPLAFYQTYSLLPVQFPYIFEDDNISASVSPDNIFYAIERDLVHAGGFFPVFRHVGVWAKVVSRNTMIAGLEHEGNFHEVPLGDMLALGIDGEPYHMSQEEFSRLYRY